MTTQIYVSSGAQAYIVPDDSLSDSLTIVHRYSM